MNSTGFAPNSLPFLSWHHMFVKLANSPGLWRGWQVVINSYRELRWSSSSNRAHCNGASILNLAYGMVACTRLFCTSKTRKIFTKIIFKYCFLTEKLKSWLTFLIRLQSGMTMPSSISWSTIFLQKQFLHQHTQTCQELCSLNISLYSCCSTSRCL